MALYLFLFFLGCFIFSVLYSIGFFFYREKWEMWARLERLQAMSADIESEDILDKPIKERIFLPMWQSISSKVARLAPVELKNSLNRRLLQAGYPLGFGVQEFLTFQAALFLGLPAFLGWGGYFLGLSFFACFFLFVCGFLFAFLVPVLLVSGGIAKRRKEIQRRLPDILDLLTVSVEAGLGFDGALAKVVEKTRGVLSEEFQRVLQEIRMGKSRHEAMWDLGARNGVEDLTAFAGAIIQADQLGVSIGNVLRVQSEEMRRKRRQRAEETAMKAPVKMMFPLIFFIFPSIFIVLLGPAAIQLLEMFKK